MEAESSDPKIIVALIAAIISVVVSVFNAAWGYLARNRIERLKNELAEVTAEKNARRDYEYEARKRLYEECEPIFFQLNEASQNSIHRIFNLSRASRDEELGLKEGGWLSAEGYYSISTYYNLFAPAAFFKLLRNRLTFIDMNVDPIVKARYELLRWSYLCWTDDFEFARFEPSIDYSPNVSNWRDLRKTDPHRYWRQGLPMGRLDSATDALLRKLENGADRLITFGEFEKAYRTEGSDTRAAFKVITDIFFGFDPRTRPVLWRILVTQAYICQGMQNMSHAHHSDLNSPFKPIQPFADSRRAELDWRHENESNTDEDVFISLDIAERYLTERLSNLHHFNTHTK